ncbi:GntR family transcriptional regulator [Verticiella sediminum]|nr:GntR family transcriptional regulator [Verticiella sediminum]
MAASDPADPVNAGRSAADQVFHGILAALEARSLVPGQRLVEADLATQFAVGRNSVREGLQRLVAEGLAEQPPHRSATIRRLSEQETLDVLDVAERMTGLLARSAARGARDPARAPALPAALAALARAHEANDDAAFSDARRQFYRALLRMSANRELARLFPSIQMPIVHAQYRIPGLAALRLADYGRIADAVLRGDAEAADAAGMAHVGRVRAALLARPETP